MARYRADEYAPYFCTITVLDWLPILIESAYVDPIIESLRSCRQHKGLQLFAFVIMPHHMHFIAAAGNAGVHGRNTSNEADAAPELHPLIRDFKRFTSRTIHDRLKQDGRMTILHWLEAATQRARQKRDELGFWQTGFHPQAIYSRAVFEQKLNYLHENPVRKGLVRLPEDWWYSSAAFYAGRKDVCMEMDWLEI